MAFANRGGSSAALVSGVDEGIGAVEGGSVPLDQTPIRVVLWRRRPGCPSVSWKISLAYGFDDKLADISAEEFTAGR
jgi:hypothetical protein